MCPPGFLQTSRKLFNAIKAEILASESVFNTHNLVLGPSPGRRWGGQGVPTPWFPSPTPQSRPGPPRSPGLGATAQLAFLELRC